MFVSLFIDSSFPHLSTAPTIPFYFANLQSRFWGAGISKRSCTQSFCNHMIVIGYNFSGWFTKNGIQNLGISILCLHWLLVSSNWKYPILKCEGLLLWLYLSVVINFLPCVFYHICAWTFWKAFNASVNSHNLGNFRPQRGWHIIQTFAYGPLTFSCAACPFFPRFFSKWKFWWKYMQ